MKRRCFRNSIVDWFIHEGQYNDNLSPGSLEDSLCHYITQHIIPDVVIVSLTQSYFITRHDPYNQSAVMKAINVCRYSTVS